MSIAYRYPGQFIDKGFLARKSARAREIGSELADEEEQIQQSPLGLTVVPTAEEVEWLKNSKSNFFKSLHTYFLQRGYLTAKQASSMRAARAPSSQVSPVDPQAASPILKVLQAARHAGLKNPKLRACGDLVFSLAKDESAHPGGVYVSQGGRYLGVIKNGIFRPAYRSGYVVIDDNTKSLIQQVMNDPYTEAKVYGQQTGSCACCGKQLTDPESVTLGIGPVCKENFSF